MEFGDLNFYHGIQISSLLFFIEDRTIPNHSYGFVLQDINLYQQPLQSPNVAVIFFVIRMVVILYSKYIVYRVFKKLKSETGILRDVTKVFIAAIVVANIF